MTKSHTRTPRCTSDPPYRTLELEEWHDGEADRRVATQLERKPFFESRAGELGFESHAEQGSKLEGRGLEDRTHGTKTAHSDPGVPSGCYEMLDTEMIDAAGYIAVLVPYAVLKGNAGLPVAAGYMNVFVRAGKGIAELMTVGLNIAGLRAAEKNNAEAMDPEKHRAGAMLVEKNKAETKAVEGNAEKRPAEWYSSEVRVAEVDTIVSSVGVRIETCDEMASNAGTIVGLGCTDEPAPLANTLSAAANEEAHETEPCRGLSSLECLYQ